MKAANKIAAKSKIVYVDDDGVNLRGFQLLYGDEYEIETLRSPRKALIYLSENEVDLIITDQKMYEMTGITFLKKVRQICPHTSTILLSRYSDYDGLVTAVNEIGIFQYISKPYDMDKMAFIIKNGIESTQLKRALHSKEMQLVESELKLSRIIETATDGIITMDEANKIIIANNAAAKMFGYTRDKLIGMPIKMLLPEEIRDCYDVAIDEFREADMFSNYVGQNTTIYGMNKSGALFPVETALSKMQIGNQVYYNAFIRDITDRVRMERRLRKSEEKFKGVFDSIVNLFTRIAGNGIIVMISPSVKNMLGYTQQEVIGTSIDLYYENPEDRERLKKEIAEHGISNNFRTTILAKDGSKRVLCVDAKFYKDKNGVIQGIEGVSRDVTEQVQLELRNDAINAISRMLNANLNLEDFCAYTYTQISKVRQYPNIYISHFDSVKEEFSIFFQVLDNKIQRNLPDKRVKGEGLSEYIINSKQGMFLNGDELNDFVAENGLKLYGKRYRSWMGVPLISEDRVVGVLSAQSDDSLNAFTQEDLSLFSFIGSQIGSLVERHKVEKEIRQFEKYFAVSMDLLCIMGTDMLFRKSNPRFLELLGHSEEELLSTSFMEFVHPDDIVGMTNELEKLSLGISTLNFENRYLCSDGTYKWLMWSATYDMDSQQIFAAAKDITEQKRSKNIISVIADVQSTFIEHGVIDEALDKILTAALLADSSAFGFITVLGRNSDGINERIHTICDVSGKEMDYINVNLESGLEMKGIEFLGEQVIKSGKALLINNQQELEALDHPELDLAWVNNFMGLPLTDGKGLIGVIGFLNKPQTFSDKDVQFLNPFLVTCSTLIKAYLDDLKKKNTEKELQQLADIVSHSSDAIISTEPGRIIISWNKGAEHLLGYTANDMIGKSAFCLCPPELVKEHDKIVDSVLKGRSIESYETTQINKEGKPVFVNMSMFPLIGENGEIKGVSSILRDISEQKEAIEMKEAFTKRLEIMVYDRTKELDAAKRELAKSLEKEKELGKIKSSFVSTASHQFRTPLAVIQASLGVLDMQKDDMTDEFKMRFDKVFTRVKEHIGRMTDLMDDALIIGKIEAGSVKPVMIYSDLVKVCEGLVANYNEIQNDGREIQFSVEGEKEDVILDSVLIEHAISNLISNAFKYSKESRSPELLVRFEEDVVKVVVIDYGIGIPESELEHLFEPFYRASNTGEYSGTGLGSAIAKEYVELNGGCLEVKSKLNKGSEFTVILTKKGVKNGKVTYC